MKRLTVILAAVAVAAFVITVSPKAHAADTFFGQLTSTDGGPTNTLTLTAKNTYSFQCAAPACIRVYSSNDGGPGDCLQDPVYPGIVTDQSAAQEKAPHEPFLIDTTTALTKITARALVDAGNPKCNVWLRSTKQPN